VHPEAVLRCDKIHFVIRPFADIDGISLREEVVADRGFKLDADILRSM